MNHMGYIMATQPDGSHSERVRTEWEPTSSSSSSSTSSSSCETRVLGEGKRSMKAGIAGIALIALIARRTFCRFLLLVLFSVATVNG